MELEQCLRTREKSFFCRPHSSQRVEIYFPARPEFGEQRNAIPRDRRQHTVATVAQPVAEHLYVLPGC